MHAQDDTRKREVKLTHTDIARPHTHTHYLLHTYTPIHMLFCFLPILFSFTPSPSCLRLCASLCLSESQPFSLVFVSSRVIAQISLCLSVCFFVCFGCRRFHRILFFSFFSCDCVAMNCKTQIIAE